MTRDSGWLASTNHFTTPELRDHWLESEPLGRFGNSQALRGYGEQSLAAAVGQVDIGWTILVAWLLQLTKASSPDVLLAS